MKFQLDKIGTLGVWLAALSCPVCFPALGVLVSLLGLGFLSAFEVIAITVLLPYPSPKKQAHDRTQQGVYRIGAFQNVHTLLSSIMYVVESFQSSVFPGL